MAKTSDFQNNVVCRHCTKRDTCTKLCRPMEQVVSQKGALWERNRHDRMELVADRGSVRLSAMKIANKDSDRNPSDTLTYDDLNFNTDGIQEDRTSVFCERFFHKRSFADIADQLNTSIENVYTHYHQAFEMAEKLLKLMGTRDKGLKLLATRNKSEFTYDQKAFLLNQVFGFSTRETAEVLGKSSGTVKIKVRRLKKKYHELFDQAC